MVDFGNSALGFIAIFALPLQLRLSFYLFIVLWDGRGSCSWLLLIRSLDLLVWLLEFSRIELIVYILSIYHILTCMLCFYLAHT